jgi:hypothetical protein
MDEHRTIYFRSSLNAIDWSPPIKTNVIATSIDVKLEEATGLFHMYYIAPLELHAKTYLAHRVSGDGVTWSDEETLCEAYYAFPSFAHNVGVTGNPNGHLLDTTYCGYGGPGVYPNRVGSLNTIEEVFTAQNYDNRQYWDLYFHVIGDSATFQRGYFCFQDGGPPGNFFSDGQNWWVLLTAQDISDHKNQNPRRDPQLGKAYHTQIGTYRGPWHSGMYIPP